MKFFSSGSIIICVGIEGYTEISLPISFKVTREEIYNLRSKKLTSSWGGSRHLVDWFQNKRVKKEPAHGCPSSQRNRFFIVEKY